MSEPVLPPAPYPGLRAFRAEESLIFCGRAEHRAEILDILDKARFLAVVGASGSGKSSLVLAGLLPDIRDGQLIGVDPETVRIVSMQPGLRPFANLAEMLARELGADLAIEPVLRRGPLGLVQLLDEVENAADRALVVVIDQFEEIFRFADLSNADLVREDRSYAGQPLLDGTQNEAQAFVNLLLATALQTQHPIYILLTMRSDFLARCDQFTGLPEAISRSQFLTPRLNRQQLEQAITRPIRHYGGSIQPELVNLMLNQISTEQDQLPLMQHALARMWERRKTPVDGAPAVLTVEDYREVGGMVAALNNHGDLLCEELGKPPRSVSLAQIERFFRCLAHHVSPNIPPVRRPARISQIAQETGIAPDTVRAIADAFRAEGCHLLMPPATRVRELKDETFIDISHESLLRQWKRLKDWTDAEWRQRKMAEDLVVAMEDWRRIVPHDSKDPIARFQSWRHAGQAVATRLYRDAGAVFFHPKASATLPLWAKRYGIDWGKLSVFCERAFRWKKMTAVLSQAGIGLVVLSLLLVWALFFALRARKDADNAQLATAAALRKVEYEKKLVEQARVEAEESLQNAIRDGAGLRQDSLVQNQVLERVINVVSASAQSVPEVKELLKDSEVQPFLVQKTAPLPATDPASREPVVAGTSSPVQFAIPAAQAGQDPNVAFLWGDREVLLITGAFAIPTSLAWNLTVSKEEYRELPLESPVLVSAPDGRNVLAFGGSKQIRLIKAGGEISISGDCEATVMTARVIQGEPLQVLFGTTAGKIGLWDGKNGKKPLLFATGRPGAVNGVDYVPATRALLASGDQNWVRVWILPAGTGPLTTLQMPSVSVEFQEEVPVRRAAFSPSGRLVLLPIGTAVKLATARPKGDSTVLPHPSPVTHARFSPDEKILATADDQGRVYLWDIASAPGKIPPPVVLSGHRAKLSRVLWSPNSDFLFTSGDDGVPIVWQQPMERLRGNFNDLPVLLPSHPGGVSDAAISPDGKRVATVGVDKVVRVYPVRPSLRGTAREWGGPKDQFGEDGNLALLSAGDIKSPDFAKLFLATQPPGTKGLISRLNPDSNYVNARWDYSFTPRSTLRSTKMRLQKLDAQGNPVGKSVVAQAVDWGPPASSGYTFDLSPGAIRALGLGAGDRVEMEILLLAPKPQRANAKK